jgi:hypothetical protein
MRSGRWVRGLTLGMALCAGAALADPYDFKLYKLGSTFQGPADYDLAANAKYRMVMRQLAAAVTATNLAPPETLGHSAFAISADLQVVDFGLPGTIGGNEVRFPTEGDFKGPLLMPSVHIRKGLPWSFELGARVGWVEKSRMPFTTLELKFAVNEGFTYLPDIGIRAHITKILNTRDFDLTVGGFDLGLGKQFAIGGMITVTPYAGWNLAFAGSTSDAVDFNPTRTLAQSEPGRGDLNFYKVSSFEPMPASKNAHNRFYGGGRFISGALMIGVELSYTVIGTFEFDPSSGAMPDSKTASSQTVSVPGVFSFNSCLGLDF